MKSRIFLYSLLAIASSVSSAQQMLSNQSIMDLQRAGLSEELILTTINNSPGKYDTSTESIIALKKAGLTDKEIAAMLTKNAGPNANTSVTQDPQPSPTANPGPDPNAKPRIYLQSVSRGTNQNAARDQSMEMSKDFERDCPEIRVTLNQQMADYTVNLNHIEVGLFIRDNQIQVADHNGDLISKTKEGGSISTGVKRACNVIVTDWYKTHPDQMPPPPPPTPAQTK